MFAGLNTSFFAPFHLPTENPRRKKSGVFCFAFVLISIFDPMTKTKRITDACQKAIETKKPVVIDCENWELNAFRVTVVQFWNNIKSGREAVKTKYDRHACKLTIYPAHA